MTTTPTGRLMNEIADEMERRSKKRRVTIEKAAAVLIAWGITLASESLFLMFLARSLHEAAPAVPAVGYLRALDIVVFANCIAAAHRAAVSRKQP